MFPDGPAGVLAALVAAIAGYAAGSLPVARWIARSVPGERSAGPGWALLALVGELSKGVLPVAIATVTWSWPAGWAAGLGALLGACWPALGRLPGSRGLAVFAAVSFTLAPAAGVICVVLALAAMVPARILGGSGRVAAVIVAIVTYPLLFYAAYPDPARLAGLLALYTVIIVRRLVARPR